ncbi:MAG: hypothetical protein FD181_108 [Prolixibacteraceae bacterium]|nr:MAG: hypothetical protein FD181_108 [Prolixibacteraceae bacterium]
METKGNQIKPAARRKKKYRLKKGVKKKLLIFSVAIVIIVAAIIVIPNRKPNDGTDELPEPKMIGMVRVDKYSDLNELHLKLAKANGIKGFKSDKEFKENVGKHLSRGELVEIENNNYYVVDKLTHSHPYLTPKAAKLLDDIGKRFQQKLAEQNLKNRYYQITSLLRTGESQRRLSRSNVNASSNTSHLYGTTFDITYARVFSKPKLDKDFEIADGPAIKLLSEVIGELRKEGRCLVVTERRERCFHITVK